MVFSRVFPRPIYNGIGLLFQAEIFLFFLPFVMSIAARGIFFGIWHYALGITVFKLKGIFIVIWIFISSLVPLRHFFFFNAWLSI